MVIWFINSIFIPGCIIGQVNKKKNHFHMSELIFWWYRQTQSIWTVNLRKICVDDILEPHCSIELLGGKKVISWLQGMIVRSLSAARLCYTRWTASLLLLTHSGIAITHGFQVLWTWFILVQRRQLVQITSLNWRRKSTSRISGQTVLKLEGVDVGWLGLRLLWIYSYSNMETLTWEKWRLLYKNWAAIQVSRTRI